MFRGWSMLDALKVMPRYQSYKDSGIDWLGEVPEDWDVRRLKNCASINPPLRLTETERKGNACFLPMESVSADGKVDYSRIKEAKCLVQGFTSFRKDDVIIAKITPCFENGKGACLDTMPTSIGFGSTEFHILQANTNSDSKFLYYLSKSDEFMKFGEQMMTGSAGQKRVSTDFVENFLFASPSLHEQTAIATYLDRKTAQIDQAVQIKQQQIALLKERKQILIQNAVTRGLNPDVPLRDSGIEWIGEIPAHWAVKRLKYILEERNERSKTGEEPLFMVSQVHGLVLRSEYHDKAEVAQSNIDNKIVYKNDLVFNKLKAHLGVFFKSNIEFEGIVSPDYAVYKPKAYISDLKFLELLFRHPAYIGQFVIRATGIVEGLIRLYTGDLFDISVPVPPKDEQENILTHIETQSTKIDQAIDLQQQQIERLKEYKATLINSAVTGKIKVPGVAAKGQPRGEAA